MLRQAQHLTAKHRSFCWFHCCCPWKYFMVFKRSLGQSASLRRVLAATCSDSAISWPRLEQWIICKTRKMSPDFPGFNCISRGFHAISRGFYAISRGFHPIYWGMHHIGPPHAENLPKCFEQPLTQLPLTLEL